MNERQRIPRPEGLPHTTIPQRPEFSHPEAQRREDVRQRIGTATKQLGDGFGMTIQPPHLEGIDQLETLADGLEAVAREYRKDQRARSVKNPEYKDKVRNILQFFSESKREAS